jgi:hypothetical protein
VGSSDCAEILHAVSSHKMWNHQYFFGFLSVSVRGFGGEWVFHSFHIEKTAKQGAIDPNTCTLIAHVGLDVLKFFHIFSVTFQYFLILLTLTENHHTKLKWQPERVENITDRHEIGHASSPVEAHDYPIVSEFSVGFLTIFSDVSISLWDRP